MKVNNVIQQPKYSQHFNGRIMDTAGNFMAKHAIGLSTLAGASAVSQKAVMTLAECTIGSAMDILIGKAITKITKEKDNRTNESSKLQAIRTFSQSLGGAISGIIIRYLCISAAIALCSKQDGKLSKLISKGINPDNTYKMQKNADLWGKSIGGFAATCVMLFTNFIIDIPVINKINTEATKLVNKIFPPKEQSKEAE